MTISAPTIAIHRAVGTHWARDVRNSAALDPRCETYSTSERHCMLQLVMYRVVNYCKLLS